MISGRIKTNAGKRRNSSCYVRLGRIGASLAEPLAGGIVHTAIDVVSNEHSGEPVTYHG